MSSEIRARIIQAATGVPYLDGALINQTALAAAAEFGRIVKERMQAQSYVAYQTPEGVIDTLLSEIESERPNSESVIRERTSATEGDGVSVSVPTPQLPHDAPSYPDDIQRADLDRLDWRKY